MVTAVKAGKHICLSPSRFRDLVDAGIFERMPPGKYDLTTVREAYCRYAQKVMQGRGDDGGKALSERRGRLAEAQTVAVELKNRIASGEYVRLDAVQRAYESDLTVFRETALSTPGKVADAVSAHTKEDRAAVFEIIFDEICEMLEILSEPKFVGPRLAGPERRRLAEVAKEAEEAERRRLYLVAYEAMRAERRRPADAPEVQKETGA
jgi:hypothetical protein